MPITYPRRLHPGVLLHVGAAAGRAPGWGGAGVQRGHRREGQGHDGHLPVGAPPPGLSSGSSDGGGIWRQAVGAGPAPPTAARDEAETAAAAPARRQHPPLQLTKLVLRRPTPACQPSHPAA